MKRIALTLLLSFFLISQAHAQAVKATFGVKESDETAYPIEYKNDGIVYYRTDGGVKWGYELVTTTDTLTLQETGKKFIVNPTSTMTLNLPDAAVGATFKFTQINGNVNKKLIINPDDSDTLRAVVNSGAVTTYAAGDATRSSGTTGDSLELFCAQDGFWDITDIRGTWTDVN